MAIRNNFGMTLIEVTIAMAVLAIIATAIVTMGVTAISVANKARIKSQATRHAQTLMEKVKEYESKNRETIQAGNWNYFITDVWSMFPGGNTQLLPYTTSNGTIIPDFFKYAGNVPPPAGSDLVSVWIGVYWNWNDVNTTCYDPIKNCVVLKTQINKWK